MFVHEAVAAPLPDAGVGTMFGLISDANLYMVNSFAEAYGGRYVSVIHEAGAIMMAQGYDHALSECERLSAGGRGRCLVSRPCCSVRAGTAPSKLSRGHRSIAPPSMGSTVPVM
ncbi:thiamine pyrophosphate-binding protein [Streptosporangium sp. NPDC002544]|uniref:thiamine pyrophosphate-binding protein n=1 Tax=Streptosporangium sp. NPDC002544 TaxID=3154538 RepID=UPI0033242B7C